MSRQLIHIPPNIGASITDTLASFVGSWLCVALHTVWFVLWFVLRLDTNLLTNIVSLEAIYLMFVLLMSQNRQGEKDHARDDLESDEVQSLFDNHMLMLKINEQQLEILTLLKGRRSKRLAPSPVVEEPV
jgi:uncharacterized membrane protein